VPVLQGFNYEAHNAPAYKFNKSVRNISAIGEHLATKFYCACAKSAISGLRIRSKFYAVGFGNPDFLYITDILTIGGHLPCNLDL